MRGWGLADERWHTLEMVSRLGGPDWFRLGNRDLGTHLMRTAALAAGESLTAITDRFRRALGVGPRLLPMCDGLRQTAIDRVTSSVSTSLMVADYKKGQQLVDLLTGAKSMLQLVQAIDSDSARSWYSRARSDWSAKTAFDWGWHC